MHMVRVGRDYPGGEACYSKPPAEESTGVEGETGLPVRNNWDESS